jgi:osmoprotectant transport system ATP-binding protein
LDATQLPVHDIALIAESAIGDAQLCDGWTLVVKADGAPLGWIDAGGMRKHRGGVPLLDSMTSVGPLFRPGASLSQALDAALSSPAALGVAVDQAGKVIGGVRAGDVLAVLESQPQD